MYLSVFPPLIYSDKLLLGVYADALSKRSVKYEKHL